MRSRGLSWGLTLVLGALLAVGLAAGIARAERPASQHFAAQIRPLAAPPAPTPTPQPDGCAVGADVWAPTAGGDDASSASNWSTGQVPDAQSDVCVPADTNLPEPDFDASFTVGTLSLGASIEVDGSITVGGIQTTGTSGNPVEESSYLGSGATIELTSGSSITDGSEAFDNHGTIHFDGAAGASSSFSVQAGFEEDPGSEITGPEPVTVGGPSLDIFDTAAAAFEVGGSSDTLNVALYASSGGLAADQSLDMPAQDNGSGNAADTVTLAGSFTNAGTITMDHTGSDQESESDLLIPAGATLTNTGTISVSGDPSGSRANRDDETISGDLDNRGTLNVGVAGDPAAYLDVPAGSTLSNDGGTVDVLGAGASSNNQASALAIAAASTGAGAQPAASFDDGSGTLENAGTVAVQGTFTQNGASITGTDPIELNNGSALAFTGSGPGAFVVADPSTDAIDVSLSGDIAVGQSLDMPAQDNGSGNAVDTVTASGSFTNAGTITMDHSGPDNDSSTVLAVPSGATLTNDGSIDVSGDPGGSSAAKDSETISGDVDNAGDLNVGINGQPAAYLVLPAAGDLVNTGNVTVAGQSTLAISGSLHNGVDGAIADQGTLAVYGSFDQGAGSVATGTGENPVQLRDGSALAFTGSGPGAFVVADPSTDAIDVSLSGDIAVGQSLDMPAQDNGSGNAVDTVTASGSFTNAGTITMDHSGPDNNSSTVLALPAGDTLTNTGTLEVSGDPNGSTASGDNETIDGNLDNQGALTVGVSGDPAGYLAFGIGDDLTNTGTVTVASGDTLVTASTVTNGDAGVIANAGTFAVDGTFDQGAGTVATDPADNPIQLRNGSSIDFSGSGPGAFAVTDPSVSLISVTLAGNLAHGQSLAIAAVDNGANQGTTVSAAASFTNDGTIAFDHAGSGPNSSATLALATGATLTNAADGSIDVSGDPNGSTAGGDNEMINGNLINQGSLNVGLAGDPSAYLTLPDGFTNVSGATLDILSGSTLALTGTDDAAGGLITGSGALEVSGTFDEAATSDTGATIQLLNGANLNLLGSGAASFTTAEGSATTLSGNVAADQSVTVDNINGVCGGTLMTDSGSLTNFGTIDFESNTCGDSGPGELDLAGTLTNAGNVVFDASPGGSGEVAGQLFNTTDGTLTVQNGGDALVSGPFTNDGTVDVTNGSFDPGASFSNESPTGELTGGTYEAAAASGDTATLHTPVPVTDLAATLEVGANASLPGADIATVARTGSLDLESGYSGAITDPVLTNQGDLELGSGVAATATTYTQTLSGQLGTTLSGPPSSAANYGALSVSGAAQIAGALAVHQAAGLNPSSGDAYTPLSAGSLAGTFAQVTGAGVNASDAFAVSYSGTSVTLTDGPGPQLSTSSVSTSADLTPGQDIGVTWTVSDSGAAASGSWTDAVYLSPTPSLNRQSVLIANAAHAGGLEAGSSYQGSLTAPVPGVLPGTYYVVVIADAADQTGNLDTAGAVAASGPVTVAEGDLQLGGQMSGTIPAGGDVYEAIQPGADQTLELTASFADDPGYMSVGYGAQPSPGNDLGVTSDQDSGASQTQTIAPTQAGVYYVDLHNPSSAPAPYTLTAANPSAVIGAVSPSTFDYDGTEVGVVECTPNNQGVPQCATVYSFAPAPSQPDIVTTIHGDGFSPSTTASLACTGLEAGYSSDPTEVANETLTGTVTYVDPTEIYADFGPVPSFTGGCDLSTTTGGVSATKTSAISFGDDAFDDASDAIAPQVSVDAPAINRTNVDSYIEVNYANPHSYPIPAPILIVDAAGATLHYPGDPGGDSSSLPVLGTSPTGEPGTLAPGAKGTATLAFDSSLGEHQDVNFDVQTLQDAEGSLDFGQLVAEALPASASPQVVSYVEAAEPQDLTGEGLTERLDSDADYLASIGQSGANFSDLLGLELSRVDDYGQILTNHTASSFGYGLPGLVDTASVDAAGNVTITDTSDQISLYQKLAAGGYGSESGLQSTLAAAPSGGYVLTQPSGATVTFNATGQETQSTDAYGNATAYTYDSAGEVTQIAEPDDTLAVTWSNGLVSSITDVATGESSNYTYSAAGELASVTSGGQTETYTWNSSSNVALDRSLASVTSAAGGGTTTYAYDSAGRLSAVTAPDGTVEESYSYPSAGEVDVTDALGNTTEEELNASGNPIRETLSDGTTVTESSNAAGQLTGISAGDESLNFGYDADGDLTSLDNQLGAVTTFGYSAAQTQSNVTEPNGLSYAFTTNSEGSLTGITDPAGNHTSVTYSPQGQLATVTDRDDNTIALGYSSAGQLSSQTLNNQTPNSYGYNADGDLSSATGAAGTTGLSFNAQNQLTAISYPNGLGLSYTYDSAGREASETTTDGYTVEYNYGPDGRLSSLTHGSSPLQSYTYTPDGQPSVVTAGNGDTQTYAYNARGQVSSITDATSSGATTGQYVYTRDPFGQVTSVQTPSGTATYTYDAFGEISSATLPDGRKLTYTYDSAGNRISSTDSGGAADTYRLGSDDEYASDGADDYGYDRDGALTSQTGSAGTTAYTWTPTGQLASATEPNGTKVTYQYDALGNLISEDRNGTITDVLTDPLTGDEIGTYSASNAVEDLYPQGSDGVIGEIDPAGQSYYYDYDASGNVVGLTGSGGTSVDSFSYLPFGGVDTQSGSVATPFGFQGQYGIPTDPTTGLTQNRLRWYSPALGRFISQDSDLESSTNPYDYADNDPLLFTDTSGMSPIANNGNDTPGSGCGDANSTSFSNDTNGTITLSTAIASGFAGTSNVLGPTGTGLSGTAAGQNPGYYVTAGAGVAGLVPAVANGEYGNAVSILNNGGNLAQDGGTFVGSVYGGNWTNAAISGFTTLGDAANLGLNYIFSEIPYSSNLLNGSEAYLNCISAAYFTQNAVNTYDTQDPINHDWKPKVHVPSQTTDSNDPNSITGPMGVTSQGYVPAGAPLSYEVNFTNDATASLPADKVVVTEPLDPNVDLSTFSLGSFGFANHTVSPPPGLTSYTTTIHDAASGLDVDVSARLDSHTRTVTWTFAGIDPATGEPPANPADGWLAPDQNPPEGEGFVTYSVSPASSVSTGTVISAGASIVFDGNPAIATPTVTNTIDADTPAASVAALPITEAGPFTVSWADAANDPAGISGYDVDVSDNGGAYTPLESDTTDTSTTFTGQAGHTYSFIAWATDGVGDEQSQPSSAQAYTLVQSPGTTTSTAPAPAPAPTPAPAPAPTTAPTPTAAPAPTSSPAPTTSPTPAASTRTLKATDDNQAISVTLGEGSACLATSAKLSLNFATSAIKGSRQAALSFRSAAVDIDQGVEHTRTVRERVKVRVRGHTVTKTELVTQHFYSPDATITRPSATSALRLTGLRSGTHTLKLVITYTQKATVKRSVTVGHRKVIKSVTVTRTLIKTLTSTLTIC